MANRRLAAFAQQYLQYMLQSRLQEQQAENVYDRQERNNGFQDQRQLRQMALADPTGRVASLTGQNEYQPSGRALLGGLGKNISGAKTLADLPTNEGLRSDAARTLELGGHDPSGAINGHLPMQRQSMPSIGGALPSSSLMPTERPDIAELIKQREAQKESILNNYSFEDDRTLAMAEGTKEAEAKGVNDAANAYIGDVNNRSRLTSTQNDQNRLSTLTTTGPAEARQAGRVSGAQAGAATQARITTEANNLDAIARITKAQNIPTITDGQRRVAGQLQPLLNAHAKMMGLGQTGEGLTGGILMTLGNPALANTLGSSGFYTESEKQFGQAAAEWGNIAGYIISGVAVREDERGNFISAMVENKKDPPQLRQQKQRAREAFIHAAEISAGQAGPIAGQAIAQAIKSGDLPANIVNMLQFTPEVQAGLTQGLSQ